MSSNNNNTPSSPRKILGSQENVTTTAGIVTGGVSALSLLGAPPPRDHSNNNNNKSNNGKNHGEESPPKPPRSAFMCYSDAKKKEIMRMHGILKENDDMLKVVASEWRKLSDRERYHWEEEARNDKVRFVREKAEFKGVWVVPKRRAKKHPNAPKRPMSAFLAYSQTRRAKVKEENPDMGNTDVSRLLGEMWRNASTAERAPYVETEQRERAVYKEKIKQFREKQAKDDAASRTSHHAVQQLVDYSAPVPPPPPPPPPGPSAQSSLHHQQMYIGEGFGGDMNILEPLQVQSVEDAINTADQRVSGYRPAPMPDQRHFRPYVEKDGSKKDQRMFRPYNNESILPAEEGTMQQPVGAYRGGYSPSAYHQAYRPPYHGANGDRTRDNDYQDHHGAHRHQRPPSRMDDGSSRYAASNYFADNNTHPSFGFYHYP